MFRIEQDGFFAGTNVPYAIHHQFGAPAANVPMRKPAELTEAQRRQWVKILQRAVIDGRKG